MGFHDQLAIGQIAESAIAQWLRARGACVLPAYQVEQASGKGPQLFTPDAGLVAPDLLVFTASRGILWIEAKHKSVFTWWRQSGSWTTGIDLRHYGDYLRVAKATHLPVWLLFFHRCSTPDPRDVAYGCPEECPTGLFGGDLFDLVTQEDHRTPPLDAKRTQGVLGHGPSGMVYWDVAVLKKLATTDQVLAVAAP